MDTVETLIPGVAHVYSGQGLKAPVGREDPRIAVEGTDGNEVALPAFVLHRRIEPEWELQLRCVVVAIDCVEADEVAVEGGAEPSFHLPVDEQVSPFLLLVVVGRPRTIASAEHCCPVVGELQFET